MGFVGRNVFLRMYQLCRLWEFNRLNCRLVRLVSRLDGLAWPTISQDLTATDFLMGLSQRESISLTRSIS